MHCGDQYNQNKWQQQLHYVINNEFLQLKFKSTKKTTQQQTTLPMSISHKEWMIFFVVK